MHLTLLGALPPPRTKKHTTSDVDGGGCATMEDLYRARVEGDGWTAMGPVYVLDENNDIVTTPAEFTGKWLLTSGLRVLGGSTFYCKGTSAQGDCDELRLQSTGPEDYHEVKGHGGSLHFEGAIVTSWDTPNKQPQEVHEGGRSSVSCISEKAYPGLCSTEEYGECRMDIIKSEMGYMGWPASESSGLTWKVRGFCSRNNSNDVFASTNVYGDIEDSHIHHMYYGVFAYGHQDGVWNNNKIYGNAGPGEF